MGQDLSVQELLGVIDSGAHIATIAEREAAFAPWPDWANPDVLDSFAQSQITHAWSHQIDAAERAWNGQHVVVATGTASGKSLIYRLLGLTAIANGRDGSSLHGHRDPTVLYIAPTKALSADQKSSLPPTLVRAATVDGDNSFEERRWARDHANWILTNPDTLHHVMLPNHQRWSRFFRGLRFVVIDESHHYRGVFGAHVAQIIRRLRRIAAHYDAEPIFILASATSGQPKISAENLTGLPMHAVVDDGSPHGARTIALIEPPIIDNTEPPIRRSPTSQAGHLLSELVVRGVRSLCFVPSRRLAEIVALNAQRELSEVNAELINRVATYRGGYLAHDRRELEQALRSGELLGLATTNALELGIDISGLDCVITVGFPGTRAALWQQFGRAGREGKESLGILIARDDPLDAYLIAHPETLLDAGVEATVFDPQNPYVLGPHLAAAAQELPLRENDFELFGPMARAGVTALAEAKLLRERPTGWYWTKRERASDLADIRSSGGIEVQIVEVETGRVLGTVNAANADSTVHTGAIYVHQGETYEVVDFDHHVALVQRNDPGFFTMAASTTSVSIIDANKSVTRGNVTANFGVVDVTNHVTSFIRRMNETNEVLGEEPLDMPEHVLQTKAVWWTIDPHFDDDINLAGAAHGAEHAAIGLLPLLAVCDRWDIGGLSTVRHPDTGELTIFVYDGYPGGAGFAERGFKSELDWLIMTRDAIAQCECLTGCPSCIHSPKCGNGNEPLDKVGAIQLLDALISGNYERSSR